MIFNQGAFYLLAFATIGTLLAASLLIVNNGGALTASAIAVKKKSSLLAMLWFLTSFFAVIFKVRDILNGETLDSTTLNSYLTQTNLGKSMFFQMIGLAILTLALPLIKRVIPLVILTGIALLSLIAPIFQSHAASNGSHSLAIGALVTHVVALSLWVGGLAGILFIPKDERITALYRFSVLALWAAIAVVFSGVATAWTRLNNASAWNTQYAYVVIAKVILTIALFAMGYANRKALASRDEMRLQELLRLISVEAMVMTAVVLMGSWLSQIQPPTGDTSNLTEAQLIVGMPTPPQPSIINVLKLYNPDALMIAILITAGPKAAQGKTLEAVAKETGQSPVDATITLLRERETSIASFNQSEADIAAFMTRPWVMTSSDASQGHPRYYASFARAYATYVRDKKVLTLHSFIERSTVRTARSFGLADRGELKPGAFADVIVFDPNRFAPQADYAQPSLFSRGMRFVLVNGQIALDEGEPTGRAGGKPLLRRPPSGQCP